MLGSMMNGDSGGLQLRRSGLELTRLQVAREVREERAGDLDSDAVSLTKDGARDEARQLQLVDGPGLEELSALLELPVAGALDIRPWAHQIEGPAVGSNIENLDPEVEIPAITGEIDRGLHGADDREVGG